MGENQKFILAMIAPVGITVMGFAYDIKPMFIMGLALTSFVIFARFLRSRM